MQNDKCYLKLSDVHATSPKATYVNGEVRSPAACPKLSDMVELSPVPAVN